jgi:hypothetical protein
VRDGFRARRRRTRCRRGSWRCFIQCSPPAKC